ncbi:MAG TPA: GH1 family beta-glucosidase [Chitinophagaceae bacterium]|jgi:beta-glucosidase|nr:GH1 family beta-glucosidase [Chitinophagaceae bacterium]
MSLHPSDFGPGFAWGVASSAYQTEGAYRTDGKGLSIWDSFCMQPGRIRDGSSGNTAADFYNRFIPDLILMQYLGIRNFRFSLSWPRILPGGTGARNEKGLDFYDRLIDFCLELGIEPWVTLYHWDLPQALEDRGGWANRDILNWFSEYVETCVLRYGDRVRHWMVLNEPMVFTGAGYFLGIHAPGRKSLSAFLAAAHHAVLCQALGGRIIRSLNGRCRAGTTFSASHIEPSGDTRPAREAASRVDALTNRMFLEPLLGLGYPVGELKVLQGIGQWHRDGDDALMAFDMDFIGVQNYTREVVRYSPLIPYLNARVVPAGRRGVPQTAMGWEVYPESIYAILKKYSAYPGMPELVVTENGAAFPDTVCDGVVHDPERIGYLSAYLEQVRKARREGVRVEGYFLWTFTDNFEWAEGLSRRFGIVYTDFRTQKRLVKSSGYWLQQFLREAAATEKSFLRSSDF